MNEYLARISSISKNNKYTKWYCSIIEQALTRPMSRKEAKNLLGGYVESHHILPKSFELGGGSDKTNLVFLTAKEHYVVHLLLTRMLSGRYLAKMNFAFLYMVQRKSPNHTSRYTSKLYDIHKRSIVRYDYTRVYKLDKVKFLHNSEPLIIKEYEDMGWTKQMTDEYKVGRVGGMAGKKQPESQKKLVRAANYKRMPSKMILLYFLDIKIKINLREVDIDAYTNQGWAIRATPEYLTARSRIANANMSVEKRKKTGLAISKAKKKFDYTKPCPHCGHLSKSTNVMKNFHYTQCKNIKIRDVHTPQPNL